MFSCDIVYPGIPMLILIVGWFRSVTTTCDSDSIFSPQYIIIDHCHVATIRDYSIKYITVDHGFYILAH